MHVLFSYHTPHPISIVTASSPPPPPLTDAPYFTTIPASRTINSSTILQNMQCQATSNPGPPTIAWWSPSGQVLGVSGGSPVLGPLSGRDSGVYTCVATNAVGTSTAGVSVTVLGGWSVCCCVGHTHAERVFFAWFVVCVCDLFFLREFFCAACVPFSARSYSVHMQMSHCFSQYSSLLCFRAPNLVK